MDLGFTLIPWSLKPMDDRFVSFQSLPNNSFRSALTSCPSFLFPSGPRLGFQSFTWRRSRMTGRRLSFAGWTCPKTAAVSGRHLLTEPEW